MKKCFFFILFVLFFSLSKSSFAVSKNELVEKVTATRRQSFLPVLSENSKLNQAAAAKLADMQKYLYWSHDNPTTSQKWDSFIRQTGFKTAIAENLASNFSSSDKIITAWINSPSHRKNLLNPKYNAYGVAIGQVNYPSGPKEVVVFHFGTVSKSSKLVSLSKAFSIFN
ncbi:MAG TPA: CAP domain-containing protein [Candidatus Woesebacteria bacterium]|nr:CAP domain-containing protein [Candidatus Woesebacteria bacterium]